MNRKLIRSTRDKVFGGVCSGLAQYFQVDVTFLRTITVILDIITGIFPLLAIYVICVIVIPTDIQAYYDSQRAENYNNNQYNNQNAYGNNEGFNNWQEEQGYTPAPSDPKKTRFLIGGFFIVVGILLVLKLYFDVDDFKYIFPAGIILAGIALILKNRGEGNE